MAEGTPQLLVVDAGLAAASVAEPTGPFVNITGFQIGDGYGYTPQVTDTSINGNLLYAGTPLTYAYVGNNTLNITCQIPADAGPFQFGEIALMMGSVMFGKAVFPALQNKFSSLGSNVASTYTFNCLLTLAQSVAILQISNALVSPDVITVARWSDVYPADLMANPNVQMLIVAEEAPIVNAASSLIQTSPTQWDMGATYQFYAATTVVNSTANYVEVPSGSISNEILTNVSNTYVVRTADGYFRSILSVVVSTDTYRLTYVDALSSPMPAADSTIDIYVCQAAAGAQESVVNYVQQGGGTGQGNDIVQIGYGSSLPNLLLQVAGTNFGDNWPINVSGASCNLFSGGTTSGALMTFSWVGNSGQPTWVVGGNASNAIEVYNPSNFSVNHATTAGTAAYIGNGGNTASPLEFLYSGNSGTPEWVWGNNGGTNEVWNPANFSVAYATNAGHATTASNGGVTSVNGAAGAVVVGVLGTSFSEPSRALSSWYQNTSSTNTRIIMVSIDIGIYDQVGTIFDMGPNESTYYSLTSDGKGGNLYTVTFMVPPLWYYRLRPYNNTTQSISNWMELG